MNPVNAIELVKKHRQQLGEFNAKTTFPAIRIILIDQLGFSDRQADWTIDLYVNALEEAQLNYRFNSLSADPEMQNWRGVKLYQSIQAVLTLHEALDCIKVWFDQNVRLILKAELIEHGLEKEQLNYVLYDLCEFSPQQFKENELANIRTALPYNLPNNEIVNKFWQQGIKTGRQEILIKFATPIAQYLGQYLDEEQVKEICTVAFALPEAE